MSEPKERRIKDCGPLHSLLIRACLPHTKIDGVLTPDPAGDKSIAILAHTLGLSAWGVQKWANRGKIPPGRVIEIVNTNPEEVSIADFSPFVYGLGS